MASITSQNDHTRPSNARQDSNLTKLKTMDHRTLNQQKSKFSQHVASIVRPHFNDDKEGVQSSLMKVVTKTSQILPEKDDPTPF